MKNFKSLFLFDRKQQRGIFVLIILLLIVLAGFFYSQQLPKKVLFIEDSSVYQHKVDSLVAVQQSRRDTIYPFNPNYITDYRGYKL
ncbi:MAG: hypothetical protein ACJAVQ_002306, partial [Nonlabens sp.]